MKLSCEKCGRRTKSFTVLRYGLSRFRAPPLRQHFCCKFLTETWICAQERRIVRSTSMRKMASEDSDVQGAPSTGGGARRSCAAAAAAMVPPILMAKVMTTTCLTRKGHPVLVVVMPSQRLSLRPLLPSVPPILMATVMTTTCLTCKGHPVLVVVMPSQRLSLPPLLPSVLRILMATVMTTTCLTVAVLEPMVAKRAGH